MKRHLNVLFMAKWISHFLSLTCQVAHEIIMKVNQRSPIPLETLQQW